MGTWGTGIFSDDFALDIKGEFCDKIADGISPADATAELMLNYKDDISDPDESSVFWFALAATQWKLGGTLGQVDPPRKNKNGAGC